MGDEQLPAQPGPAKPNHMPERQAIARDLREFDRLDRNHDGNLTGDRTYQRVKQYDANKDGKVTREEFLAGRARERAARRFRDLDRNSNGVLDGTEIKDKFRRYDTNADGVVDEAEYVTGRLADTDRLRDEMEFDRLDRSKDGFLTGQRTYKKWKKFDTNGDGKISKEEFLVGRAEERALARLKQTIDNQIARLQSPSAPETAE